jgi:hypothetical protein
VTEPDDYGPNERLRDEAVAVLLDMLRDEGLTTAERLEAATRAHYIVHEDGSMRRQAKALEEISESLRLLLARQAVASGFDWPVP